MPEPLSAPNARLAAGIAALRADGRRPDQLRPMRFQNRIAPYADGRTLTGAICGSYVALSLAVGRLLAVKNLTESPLLKAVAAVSVGMVDRQVLLDLCYVEDASAQVDMNVVMTETGEFIELQG